MHRLAYDPGGFVVMRWVGLDKCLPENLLQYYNMWEECPEVLAFGTTKTAALAAMRLLDVAEYEDWT